MILTVTPNAALDVTYGVDSLRPNTSHRVGTAHRRAGGKGVNVPRVLAARAGRRPPRPRAVHGPGARGRATRFTSVMFDASTLPYEQNLKATREITDHCRAHGVWVEGEPGEVGGKDGAHAPGVRTDPAEARDFVASTGVDALAVAVGSSHAMTTRDAVLDFALIAELRASVDVPLVLHGSSGVADADLAHAVEAGMTKVNVSTHLNKEFTRAARTHLDAHPETVDPRTYVGPARDAVAGEVAHLLKVLHGGLG